MAYRHESEDEKDGFCWEDKMTKRSSKEQQKGK